jgi:release factor glutamine methyltransferase
VTTTPTRPQTLIDYLQATTELFRKHGIDSPRLEAEMLLAHVLGIPRIQLYVRFEQPLKPDEIDRFRELVKRRGRHEPVQYILGKREFWSLELAVERGVLIPRPDTEVLVEEALAWLKEQGKAEPKIAEVGVGSGAIAISLLSEVKGATVVAGDIAEVPLVVAKKNAETHGVAERLTLVRGDGLSALSGHGPFDLVVSNPPYIREEDMRRLPPHIKSWEPPEALVSGADGLDCIRGILAALGPETLVAGGALMLEIGDERQAEVLVGMLAPRFSSVRVRKDYGGLVRAMIATGFVG